MAMLDGEIKTLLDNYKLKITRIKVKPWGFTIGVKPSSVQQFADTFFPEFHLSSEFLSSRFILVNPNSRLSWQKHERRGELWKIIKGPVGVMVSETDQQPNKLEIKGTGSLIQVEPSVRHRLVGLKKIAIIAETWIHSDKNNPSDADDIVRLDDDYKRWD